MENIKRAFALILIFLFMLGGSGCMNLLKSTSYEEKIIEMLNEKYDDTFYYSEPFAGGVGGNTLKQIYVTSDKFPNSPIWASYNKETGELQDNYLRFKFLDQTNKLKEDILFKIFGDVNYCISDDVSNGTFKRNVENASDNMTFEEFIALYGSVEILAYVDIATLDFSKEEINEKITQVLADSGIYSNCYIYLFGKEYPYSDTFSADISERTRAVVKGQYDNYLNIEMNSVGSVSEIIWEK